MSENVVFYRAFGGRVPAVTASAGSGEDQAEALERGRGEVNLSPLGNK